MFEAAILVLLASGLWVMARRWQGQSPPKLISVDDERRSLSIIAHAGLYSLTLPRENTTFHAFRDLHLVEGGIVFQDNQNEEVHLLDFSHIQWVSAVTLPQDGVASMTIHLEIKRSWYLLTLHIPQANMAVLISILRKVVASSRLNIGGRPTQPIGPIAANVAEDTLQGKINLGADVSLYLLPHMLIVLQGDSVQAKLDTSSIRRVLSVERVSGKLDSLLNPNTPDGIVRLYSLYETVAFALPQYQELAEEISYLSRCPIEFITQHDKTDK